MRGFFCALFAGILCLESIGGFCRQGYVSEGIREQATHLFNETAEKEAGQLQEDLHLYAQAAVLLDADSGRVLYGKNEETPMAMASTTKIMTCILVLENAKVEEEVSISAYAATMPKVKLYVKKGEHYTVRELLFSLMLESHNDAAAALAEDIGGKLLGETKEASEHTTEESKAALHRFAQAMNEKAVEIGGEWLYDTVLTGAAAEAAYARVVSQLKLRMEQLFIQQGNQFASTRARAHYYVEGAADEACTGVSYYHFLCNLLEKADWSALGAKLDAVRSRVLQTAALTVSLHGTEAALEKLRTLLPESRFAAARRAPAQPYTQPLTPPVNEAFIIDGGVNYDVLAWPMPRDSRRRVLARVMSYEYLWHTIREVGGAYGTGMLCADGIEFLYTYRDPHLRESYDTFADAPAALAARDYTARDLDEFIVGTAAKLDTPRKARAAARELDHRYFCGITDEMRAADRKALCSVDAALLKAQATALSDVLSGGVRVAFGSKDAVEAGLVIYGLEFSL